MDKWQIARTLDEIASYVELSETNRFKATAYERAAKAVSALDRDIEELVASGGLYEVAGIGKATGAVIEELLRTGESKYLAELRTQFPDGIFELLRVPKLGLRKIAILHSQLGIGSLDELEEACRSGRVAKVKGFGEKTQQKILGGIAYARKRESHFLLPYGLQTGEAMRERLAQMDEVENAEISGDVRRRLEVVHNIEIVVATKSPARVLKALENLVDRSELVDPHTVRGFAHGEMEVVFHVVKPADFAQTLFRTTGSAEFVAAFPATGGDQAATEEEIFKAAKIPFIAPERRETAEDLTLKKKRKLVTHEDLRGTFHVHTTYSDGRNTIAEMLGAARERGFEYVGISDHSKTAFYAGGLKEDRLAEQQAEIAKESKAVRPMRVFRGSEADILTDGSIDYEPETLETFDFVIASVHSKFAMPKDEMTERIVRAVQSPYVTFIGHLTGRLLLSRDGYTMEFDRVFEEAGKHAVMIEINGNPNRLDIDWRLIRRALDRGVMFSIHPDAHSIREYNALMTGTWVARKAGLSPDQIFNTRPAEAIAEYFSVKKKARHRG
jgi:DNA polymerase (family 10)